MVMMSTAVSIFPPVTGRTRKGRGERDFCVAWRMLEKDKLDSTDGQMDGKFEHKPKESSIWFNQSQEKLTLAVFLVYWNEVDLDLNNNLCGFF